jgi:hypothetical protein
MESASYAVLLKIPARRDDLDFHGLLVLALEFAQIWRLPGSEQSLKLGLTFGAEDLDDEIPTAGCATGVIPSATACFQAWVLVCDNRQFAPWQPWHRKATFLHFVPVHDHETITARLPSLSQLTAHTRCGSSEPMGSALCLAVLLREVAAGHVQHGVSQEIVVLDVELSKRDALRVAQEPSAIVIELERIVALEGPHLNRDWKGGALFAEGVTRWGQRHVPWLRRKEGNLPI